MKLKPKYLFLLLLFALSISVEAFYQQTQSASDSRLEIIVWDIGQGDSMLIKTPNNTIGLIDAGPGKIITQKLNNYFGAKPCSIDFAVATHADLDHIEGFISILDYCKVLTFFINKSINEKPLYNELISKLKAKDVKTLSVDDSSDFTVDNVSFDVLWPPKAPISINDTNEGSISFFIEYMEFSMVTMGDLGQKNEIIATKLIKLPLDLLKISHHGSNNSTSNELLSFLTPKFAVISVGKSNRYNHPSPRVLSALTDQNITVFRTDVGGDVKISSDGQTFKINYSDKFE